MPSLNACTEVNDLRNNFLPGDETFLNDYIDAFFVCNSEMSSNLAEALSNGEDPVTIAKAIVADMDGKNILTDAALEEIILQKLVPQNEGKVPVKADLVKDHMSQKGADPVIMYKGQFIHDVPDIHINGAGIDFVFNRSYRNQTVFNGPLGFNWTHNFHVWLREGDQVIFRSTGDLREENYTKHPRFGETINGDFDYWVPPDGIHGIILSENGSFVLRQPDGTRHIFEVDPKHSFLHRLSKIEDRFKNYLQLIYDDTNDRLEYIEINHSQRLVKFNYDAEGRICLIGDYTGRQWGYGYDSFGDLVSVTTPKTERYDCGLTVNYDYSSAFHSGNLQHNLTRIIDASGQIYLETEYGTSQGLDNFNRVVRQRQGGGEYQFEYKNIDEVFDIDYTDELRPTRQTILTERNGQSICYIYNKFGNLLRREQNIIKNGLPRLLVEQYRYNRDASPIASLSPEGVLTQHLYGRDFFVRNNPLTENGDVPTDNLSWKERQAFGRILSTVRRGGYATFNSFDLIEGEWGNFPDIIGGTFPISISNQEEDIIIKMTYEAEFGQLLTISDPRYTDSANPDANELQPYDDTLTNYFYSGTGQLLIKIKHPTPILPDGSLGNLVKEEFTQYDARGRLELYINPVGTVTKNTYFPEIATDPQSGHLQKTVVDVGGLGITTRNEVDELGRVTTVHMPKSMNLLDGRFVTHSVYNELDQVIETTSTAPFNFKARNFYDRNGKLERQESDLIDENGQLELGSLAVATFCYDEEFNLIESSIGGTNLQAHLITKHLYDRAGKRILSKLPNKNKVRIRYDERQLPVTQISGADSEDAAIIKTDYDGDGRVRRTFDARGNPTTYEFDSFGRIISVENAIGHITRTNYDKAGNVTCVRVFEKRENEYFLLTRNETEYDELNRAIRNGVNRFKDPIGPFEPSQLAEMHLSSPGPGVLLETLTFYDAKSRIDHIVDSHPLRRETHFAYDTLDRLKTVTDPLGNETHNHYDAHSNLIRTDQLDRVLDDSKIEIGQRHFANSFEFDELDRMTSTTDSLGKVSRNFYDSRNNVVRQIDPLGNEQHTSFDVFNRTISTTNFLTATGLGPVTEDAVPVTTQQEYDLNDNLISVIDALGRKTRHEYDALDRRRAIIYPNESKMLTDYDKNSNIIRTQDNNGLQRFFTLDALNRTTRIDVNANNLSAGLEVAGATFERYEYDGLDRQIVAENDFGICSFRYNSLSWPLEETIEFMVNEAPLQTPLSIVRDFDDVGALVGLTYPNGRQLQFERDELNRLTKIQNLSYGNGYRGHLNLPPVRSIAKMTYAGQQKKQCIFGNSASTNYQHDGAGRLIEIAHASANSPLLTIQYLFDAVNNVRVRNDVLPAGSLTERFAYDALYRLVYEFQPTTNESFDLTNFNPSNVLLSDPISHGQSDIDLLIGSMVLPQILPTYEYDLVGNRQIERPTLGNDIDYSNNPLDQYESRDGTNFSYDTNGNMKDDEQRKYIFDALNRLVKVETIGGQTISEFWHDASGRRILERNAQTGIITQLIHDGDDIISEYQNGNLFAHCVFDDGMDRPLHIAAEGKEHWYHADLVGSVRMLTDITGTDLVKYRYLPFGAFDIIETDDGNIFNPWRYTGRRFDVDLETYDYRTREYDPKLGRFVQRDLGGMIDGTNLFSYAKNSPLSGSDPTGYGRKEMEFTDSHPSDDYTERDKFGREFDKGVRDFFDRTRTLFTTSLEVSQNIDIGKRGMNVAKQFKAFKIGAISWAEMNRVVFSTNTVPEGSGLSFWKDLRAVKVLKFFEVLGLGFSGYNFYKDRNLQTSVDLGMSAASVYSVFAVPSPASLLLGAATAGYSFGNAGNWAVKKIWGVDSSDIGGSMASNKLDRQEHKNEYLHDLILSGQELNTTNHIHFKTVDFDMFKTQKLEQYLKIRHLNSPDFDYKEVLRTNKKYSDIIKNKYQPVPFGKGHN